MNYQEFIWTCLLGIEACLEEFLVCILLFPSLKFSPIYIFAFCLCILIYKPGRIPDWGTWYKKKHVLHINTIYSHLNDYKFSRYAC